MFTYDFFLKLMCIFVSLTDFVKRGGSPLSMRYRAIGNVTVIIIIQKKGKKKEKKRKTLFLTFRVFGSCPTWQSVTEIKTGLRGLWPQTESLT